MISFYSFHVMVSKGSFFHVFDLLVSFFFLCVTVFNLMVFKGFIFLVIVFNLMVSF